MNANAQNRGRRTVAAAQASDGEPTPVSDLEQARPDGQLSPPGRLSASEAAPQNGPRPADVLTRAGLIEFLVSHLSQPAAWSRTRGCKGDDEFRLFECATIADFLRELQGDRDDAELVRTGFFRTTACEVAMHSAFAPSLTAAMAQSRQSSNQLLRFLQFEARVERPELGIRRLSRSHAWDRLLGALPPGEQRDHPRHAT